MGKQSRKVKTVKGDEDRINFLDKDDCIKAIMKEKPNMPYEVAETVYEMWVKYRALDAKTKKEIDKELRAEVERLETYGSDLNDDEVQGQIIIHDKEEQKLDELD